MITTGKILAILQIVCLLPLPAFTQQFNYTARLDTVHTSGFYEITVSPEVSAHIKTDFADIRIADEKKQWVPHILQPVRSILKEDLFTTFPILENTVTDSGKNLVIIKNTKTTGIYNLKLLLKNAAVSRTASLSGSNNRHDWYIIDDKIAISRSYETVKDEYLQEINFPPAKYQYLKIIIDNANNDPLLITKAGFYAEMHNRKSAGYQDNPIPTFTQIDSNHCSYLLVKQNNNYQFHNISLGISSPAYYSRAVTVCLPVFNMGHAAKPGQVIGNFKLISALPAVFELPRTKTGLFFIVIKNEDNPPLKIEKVFTHQQTVTLISFLEQGKNYDLMLDDSLASFANYDLQAFKDSITVLRPLKYGKLYAIHNFNSRNPSPDKNWWIWPSIIFAGILLSYLTYRLTGNITQKNN